MRFNKKVTCIVALAIALFLVLLILGLPPLVRHIAIEKIDASTGRKSQIDKISINPFTLKAEVSGVRLSERGSSATFLAFSSARLTLSPLSLPKRSFIITELHIASPYLHVVRNAPNSFNFSDLLAEKKGEKKKQEGTPYFSLNNIIISHGSIDFQDRALKVEKFHRVRGMEIAIPFVTDIPYLADRYVAPHFSAVVNGSPIRFEGRLKPLTKAVEATVELNVKRIDLPFYLGYLPVPLPVKVRSGTLATALQLGYRVHEKSGPELSCSGNLTLDKVSLDEPGGAPLASLSRAQLEIANLLLFARRAEIRSLELTGVELYASRDHSGAWNLQKILQRPKEKGAPPQARPVAEPNKEKPLDLRLSSLTLKGGKLHLYDGVPAEGFRSELHDIDFTLRNFSLAKGQRAPFDLQLATARGESVQLAGELSAAPVEAKATLTLKGVPLKDYYPYLRDTLTAPLYGTLGASLGILYDAQHGVLLEKGTIRGDNLAARLGPVDGFRLRELSLSGLAVDLKRQKATAELLELKNGSIVLSREKDGTLSAERLLRYKKKGAPPRVAQRETRRRAGEETPPPAFSYRVARATGSGIGIKVTDRSKEEAPQFTLNRLKFSVAGITGPRQGPVPLTLAADYGKSGRIRVAGTANPEPLRFKGNVELHGIPLRDFDAYLPENTSIFIVDGLLDTRLALDLAKGTSGFTGSFSGSAGVRSFYCQDTELDEDLLKWDSLQLDRVKGTLAPLTLAINDVSLSNFYSRIIVEKDGTLNLQHLVTEEEPPPPAKKGVQPPPTRSAASPAPPAPVTAGGESAAQPHPIRIETVTLQGGTLAFSDRHLEAPFDTTFFNLGGRVSGLTSQANRYADVDLRGNLENHSPLSIKGTINPLRGDLFLDMRITFNDIELSPLTPYSDTYLGYSVDKGKLYLDLSYKIEKKALSSQNKVFIDQFSFGKQVESPKATKLPVRLAVALLKDRKGEIHLDLPVTGRTDDPQFSVWRVVLQILKNLVVKAATSPLALLGSMFGHGEDFSSVQFAPGSEQLAKPEQDKLLKLAKALHDRPALNLEILGFVDKERDAEGYRNELLLHKMQGEKFRKLAKEGKLQPGQTQDEIQILPQEYSAYLKDVYRKEKFPKPRNVLGIAKELPDEEMKKLIITHTVVGNNELQALARERGEVVKAFLMKQGGIPPERLFEKSSDIYKPSSQEGVSGSRVEFGASVK